MFQFESGFVFRGQEPWAQSQVERLRPQSLLPGVTRGGAAGQCELNSLSPSFCKHKHSLHPSLWSLSSTTLTISRMQRHRDISDLGQLGLIVVNAPWKKNGCFYSVRNLPTYWSILVYLRVVCHIREVHGCTQWAARIFLWLWAPLVRSKCCLQTSNQRRLLETSQSYGIKFVSIHKNISAWSFLEMSSIV